MIVTEAEIKLYEEESYHMFLFSLGSCIETVRSKSSEAKILNNLTESTCVTLETKSSDKETVVTRLMINKTCVTDSDVIKLLKKNFFTFAANMYNVNLCYLLTSTGLLLSRMTVFKNCVTGSGND